MQTAVEWLLKYIERENCSLPQDIEEMAKQMEKEQIKEAFINGRLPQFFTNLNEEEYYNRRYKNK